MRYSSKIFVTLTVSNQNQLKELIYYFRNVFNQEISAIQNEQCTIGDLQGELKQMILDTDD
jgi:hypothetical protein